ncbi:hypothetical protein CHS0354_014331 [Potamilus streckersoni]|uniref:Ig-like domain-containing protein n=1 Tax=Potamilus streckersoni TaxID=2493646 RepID=A0AAE0VXK0_9BIVA|nr:hypothetical protein CHS0354_014331 [Potamilus streckersoni]
MQHILKGMGPILKILELLLIFTTILADIEADSQEPNFDVPVVNVTATTGTTAILPCTINALGDRKVLWMDPRGKALTMEDRRVIFDQRISVERPYTRDWNLHIRGVKHSDSGEYMCQINTSPVKIKKVILYVSEPAKIIGQMSAGDQVVQEGEKVILWCNVTGIPPPRVTWFRKSIHNKNAAKEAIGNEGEVLIIHNITRYCDDVYECVASNDIEPADSREMKVTVEFQPEVELFTKRMSQSKGRETILDCKITANPHGFNIWRKEGKDIQASHKYGIQVFDEDAYSKTLSLRIGNIDDRDFGEYTCVAQNRHGMDQDKMLLFEHADRTRWTTTSTSTMSNSILWVMPPERPYSGIGNNQQRKINVFDGTMQNPTIIQPGSNSFSYDSAKSEASLRNQSKTISSASYHRVVQLTVCVVLFALMTR